MAGRARFRADPGVQAPGESYWIVSRAGRKRRIPNKIEARQPLPNAVGRGQPYPEFAIKSFYDRVALQRLLIVNLPKLTPSSTPVPLPVNDSETSPLVRACASDDGPAPAAAPALA
jgi:hypothetical protein